MDKQVIALVDQYGVIWSLVGKPFRTIIRGVKMRQVKALNVALGELADAALLLEEVHAEILPWPVEGWQPIAEKKL